jgi:hypothetical protein
MVNRCSVPLFICAIRRRFAGCRNLTIACQSSETSEEGSVNVDYSMHMTLSDADAALLC